MRSIFSSGYGGRPPLPLGYVDSINTVRRDQGITWSISVRNFSRRVCLRLATNSASEKSKLAHVDSISQVLAISIRQQFGLEVRKSRGFSEFPSDDFQETVLVTSSYVPWTRHFLSDIFTIISEWRRVVNL